MRHWRDRTEELQHSRVSTLWHNSEYIEHSLLHYEWFSDYFDCVHRIKCCQTRPLNWIAVMGSKRWKKRPLKGSCPSLLELMETRKILTQVSLGMFLCMSLKSIASWSTLHALRFIGYTQICRVKGVGFTESICLLFVAKAKESLQEAMVRLWLCPGSGFVFSKIRSTAHDCLTSGFKCSGLLGWQWFGSEDLITASFNQSCTMWCHKLWLPTAEVA